MGGDSYHLDCSRSFGSVEDGFRFVFDTAGF